MKCIQFEFFCCCCCSFWKWPLSQRYNVMKLDVKDENVVSKLSNVFHNNAEIHKIDLTLFDAANVVEMQNVDSKLIRCCPTSRRHNNQKTTLQQR